MSFSSFALLKTPSTFYLEYFYDCVIAGVKDKKFIYKITLFSNSKKGLMCV